MALALLSMAVVFAQWSHAEDAPQPDEVLTLDRCLEITLDNSPNLDVAHHLFDSASARVIQTRARLYPNTGAGAGMDQARLEPAMGVIHSEGPQR